ncbi:MAG: adenosylcobinamide-GDP ribazoletransferase [Ruminiclostridium sp.]
MNTIKRLVLMLQFFTRIPIKLNLAANTKDYGKGLIFAPFVGLIIGAILAAAAYGLLYLLPRSIVAAIVLVLYIIITGGLHLDGLGDTFDGIYSNRSKERILEIMRDSRVGTNAVLAVVSVLLLNYVALSQINSTYFLRMVLLMPMAGRVGSLVSAAVSKYARSGEGLGKSFIDFCGRKELFWGLLIYIVISLLTIDYKMWIVLAFPPISAFVLVKVLSSKIGGATGDILGAVCELNQCIFLILACAILV